MPHARHPFDGYPFGCSRTDSVINVPKSEGPVQTIEDVVPPPPGMHHHVLRLVSSDGFDIWSLNESTKAEIAALFEGVQPHYWPVEHRQEGEVFQGRQKSMTLYVYQQGANLHQPDVVTLGAFRQKLQAMGVKSGSKVKAMLAFKKSLVLMSPQTENNATAEQNELLAPYLIRNLKSKLEGGNLTQDKVERVLGGRGAFSPDMVFLLTSVFNNLLK